VAIALENVRREFDLPALAHHHDFFWEKPEFSPTCPPAIELADKYLPPRDEKIKHVVINSLAQKELAARRGLFSNVVPNVFNFGPPGWEVDDYNRDFRERIGLEKNDILILQATRVIARKGIELAIDFVNALDTPERRRKLSENERYNGKQFEEDSRIVLVLAGYGRDALKRHYIDNLFAKANRAGVDMIHIEDLISQDRKFVNGEKMYSLWDTYVHADFVTYPSLWEGWGNQFLEAIRARLPILIYEYPVFTADIKPKGFEVVSLGNQLAGYDEFGLAFVSPEKIESAADQAIELLVDSAKRDAMVDRNFMIGKEHFSMDALRHLLMRLLPV
jgi:glycosyltransferase involved in cell wall biosynthesis